MSLPLTMWSLARAVSRGLVGKRLRRPGQARRLQAEAGTAGKLGHGGSSCARGPGGTLPHRCRGYREVTGPSILAGLRHGAAQLSFGMAALAAGETAPGE